MPRRVRGQAGAVVAPTTERDKLFCRRWLESFDKDRAYREAGYKAGPKDVAKLASRKLSRFAEYLAPLQEAKAREVVKAIVIDQEIILKEMARTAVFDPGEYIETTAEPVIEQVKVGKKKVQRILTWDGQPVYGSRMKPFERLTPEQRMTVEVTGIVGNRVEYRLPTIRERTQAQVHLGRQYGMFIERLIIERRNSMAASGREDFEGVPTPELQNLRMNLLPYVGQEFASRLGFTLEDIEEAKKRIVAEVPAKPTR